MKRLTLFLLSLLLAFNLSLLTGCEKDPLPSESTTITTTPNYTLVDADALVNLLLAQDSATAQGHQDLMIEMTAECSAYSEDNTVIYLKGTSDENTLPFECHATADEHLEFFANPNFVVGEYVTIQGIIAKVYTDDTNGWMYVINIHSIKLTE